MSEVIPVKVALRCRPLLPKETLEGCQVCLKFCVEQQQVIVGKDKAFTYDFTFGPEASQVSVYETAIESLMARIFEGYNATVLAYGQTGSGKTYTMGSGYTESMLDDDDLQGVIPRVLTQLFDGIIERQNDRDFTVKVSFLEIYKEELRDLLSDRQSDSIAIRESSSGGIMLTGLRDIQVTCIEETVDCLKKGSTARTTGATAMNNSSSRSHAIFTINIESSSKTDSNDMWKSKFCLVDLAGSERIKKTGAEGERLKEGININRGLLCLGNVISALGDESQKRSHVPYRDSKLTRLLQDSLGGNSNTLMIACVSPADSNMEETINTLRYADRARKIKNKPIVNRDPQAAEILHLKQIVQQLQLQSLGSGFSVSLANGGIDVKAVMEKNKKLEEENYTLGKELQRAIEQSTTMCEKAIIAEMVKDKLKEKLDQLQKQTGVTFETLNTSSDLHDNPAVQDQINMVKQLQQSIIELQKEDEEAMSLGSSDMQSSVADDPKSESSDTHNNTFVLKQAKMRSELEDLNKMLAKKEELAKQMSCNDERMENMKVHYESNMKELEGEVKSLQKEKDGLLGQLHTAKATVNSSKISEQRRQRLKELENQMSALKKKMMEQSKLLKLKEQTDKQVTKMNEEITQMKQARVKLIKQLKEESDTFRKWKQEKDKEVMQLKAKDRKRQCEVVKLEQKYQRTNAVLKRKAEEAAAANRRLKDALDKQKKTSEDRALKKTEKPEMSTIGNRVRTWMGEELEVQVALKEAQFHLNTQIDDRKELSAQLTKLKQQIDDEPPTKKLAWTPERNDVIKSRNNLELEMSAITQDIDLRNAQIADLQQKLMDADGEGKAKTRWETLHTMVEAKVALKWLFTQAVNAKADAAKVRSKVNEMTTNKNEAEGLMEKLEVEVKFLQNKHEEEMFNLKKMHEDKVLFLLRQWKSNGDDNVDQTVDEKTHERLQFQEQEIQRLGVLHDKLQEKDEECHLLMKEVTVLKYQQSQGGPSVPQQTTFFTPVSEVSKARKRKANVAESATGYIDYLSLESDESGSESTDEYKDDPDWFRTPLYKGPNKEKKAKRETASPSGCNCTKKCNTKHCSCKKKEMKCSEDCGCNIEICLNKSSHTPDSTMPSVTQHTLNSTFNICEDEPDSTVTSLDDFTPNSICTNNSTVLNELNLKNHATVVKKKGRRSQKLKTDDTITCANGDESENRMNSNPLLEQGVRGKMRKLLKPGGFFSNPAV